jgi:hypothetical protein
MNMENLDEIDNQRLIENNLLHLKFELSMQQPSFFRIAREAHLLLYRSMIEALKGSANLAIMGHSSKQQNRKYMRGNGPWKEIKKEPIEGCKKAWRFSEPIPCDEPHIKKIYNGYSESNQKNFLINFYDALAKVQTECFMIRFIQSNALHVPDEDMRLLEWLHESVRNEYEHFIPKLYMAPINDLITAAGVCVHLSKSLLFQSGNVIFYDINHDEFKSLFEQVQSQINIIIQCQQRDLPV